MLSENFFTSLIAGLICIHSIAAYEGLNVLKKVHELQTSRWSSLDDGLQISNASNRTHMCTSESCYRYYNNKTQPFFIKGLPEVDWDIGEFYGGSVAINKSDPSRTLFFIFKPAINGPINEVTVWLNGGPGCSSLEGFLQENGPILWQPGKQKPVKNHFTWAKTTNMLWVEQPVGTGFAQGEVTATNEVDVAIDFVNFFKNWETLFDIKNYKIYMTGESYAGRYIPYISAQMLDQKDEDYFNLSGALMYDPCIGDCAYVQQNVPTAAFINANNEILNVDPADIQAMNEMSSRCNYTAYLNKYLVFPPAGHQPNDNPLYNAYAADCNIGMFIGHAAHKNPCFNYYHITDYCPFLSNVLGLYNSYSYFNRRDVKEAIHAPPNVSWVDCTNNDVFLRGIDKSESSIINVLPQVIEVTNRVFISNAAWDSVVYTNGTLMSIQNMTWNGKLGFQETPSTPFVVQGQVMGKQHFERGLLWVESYQSGHMQPQYQPQATYRHLEWLLGRIPSL